MASEPSGLDRLTAAVIDGAAVDWAAFLDRAATDDERRVIEQMRVLASVAHAGDEPSTTIPLRSWGPFELLEQIGRGHFGRVFRAREPRLDREVALKLVDPAADSPGTFIREAQLLARVRHPNIVIVYGADVFEGQAGLWMELIRGRSLDSLLQHEGPFGTREVALLGVDLCSALAAVHAAGLTHRDIKAQNVMRELGGRFVLMDFGAGQQAADVSCLAEDRVTGTPLYMAPELFEGAMASASTDLYSLGVLLFLMCSGDFAVRGETIAEIRRAHHANSRRLIREVRPDASAGFGQVIDRALAHNPNERFHSAAEMQEALAKTLDVHLGPQMERPAGVSGKVTPGGGRFRHLPMWVATLLVAASLVLGAAVQAGFTRLVSVPQPVNVVGMPAKAVSLSAEQWVVLSSYQELAGTLAEQGEWARAAEQYVRASEMLKSLDRMDDPQRAHLMGSAGFALTKAGRLDEAKTNIDLAIYKLTQEGGQDHSLLATLEMASACERHLRGDHAGAADAILRAVMARRRTLTAVGIKGQGSGFLDRDRLIAASAGIGPDADADGDWIPDVIERVVSLDPQRPDTDGDGVVDGEEDANADGSSNALEWAIAADPSRVLTHFGTVDPERLGYRRELRFQGQPAPRSQSIGSAWRVDADAMGFYFHKLTSAQKRAAAGGGFRLLTRGTLWQGNGLVNVDLVPLGARIDQNFSLRAGRLGIELITNSMPREEEWIDVGSAGSVPFIEYVYDPSTSQASVFLDGRRVSSSYAGHRQYQEDFGLFWGATDDIGQAPRGVADFSLILLQIR